MVAIIDYGMGNVASVQKALNFLQIENLVTADHKTISKSKVILLPGVGSFKQGMQNLRNKGLIDILTEEVIENKKPFLGICLGMQLIMGNGSEPEFCDGLGWIAGSVLKLNTENYRIPHMGWNQISVKDDTYYKGLDKQDFYFIHSYHVVPDSDSDVAAFVNYGIDIVASIKRDNIFTTQFHPEKSQHSGLNMLNQFFKANVKN